MKIRIHEKKTLVQNRENWKKIVMVVKTLRKYSMLAKKEDIKITLNMCILNICSEPN